MSTRLLALTAAAFLSIPTAARAQTSQGVSQADALFAEAKDLRAQGDQAGACTKFDESRRLAPGVGIDLYVADCLERAGRNASAWSLFTEAALLAAERNDPRANTAHARAEALALRVTRLTIVIAPGALEGSEVRLDGGPPIPPSARAGVPVDTGFHTVTLTRPGASDESAHVRVETKGVTITMGNSIVPSRPLVVAAANPAPTTASKSAPVEKIARFGRDKLEYALLGAGVVGLGVGTAFLVARNQSMAPNGAATSPHPDGADTVGATVAFGAAGAALVSAVVLYLTAPASRESALTVSPNVTIGGAGAFVSGRF